MAIELPVLLLLQHGYIFVKYLEVKFSRWCFSRWCLGICPSTAIHIADIANHMILVMDGYVPSTYVRVVED